MKRLFGKNFPEVRLVSEIVPCHTIVTLDIADSCDR